LTKSEAEVESEFSLYSWIRSQDFSRKQEQKPKFNLRLFSNM